MNVSTNKKNQLFPVFLKLEKLNCLLVGAGNVGLEKLTSLLTNSPRANVTVIAPIIKNEVKELSLSHTGCRLEQRKFTPADLLGKHLVILATDDQELHREIKRLASRKGILINVADTPDLCDFYLGSIVQKGNLKLAISTNGKSPTVAKRLRELLTELIPAEIDELLLNLEQVRKGLDIHFEEKVKYLNELTKSLAGDKRSVKHR